MRWLRNWIKKKFNLYDLDDIQTWGNCGLCGALIKKPFPKVYSWGICNNCLGINKKQGEIK